MAGVGVGAGVGVITTGACHKHAMHHKGKNNAMKRQNDKEA
jgi:hypothetical protein